MNPLIPGENDAVLNGIRLHYTVHGRQDGLAFVIVGRHDFITTLVVADKMVKNIPDVRLEIFEDSGHFAVREEPEKFYRAIKQFVTNDQSFADLMIRRFAPIR